MVSTASALGLTGQGKSKVEKPVLAIAKSTQKCTKEQMMIKNNVAHNKKNSKGCKKKKKRETTQ